MSKERNENVSIETVFSVAAGEVPFEKGEKVIMDKIVEIHNLFVELDRKHPSELQEWITAIHQLQGIIEHRVFQRLFPNYFK